MLIQTKARFILILFVAAAISGCGLASDNSAARDLAGKFYDALKTGDVKAAAGFCGTDETMTTQAWEDLFTQNLNTMGNVTDYKGSSGFDVSKENGKSTVHVAYDVSYQYGTTTDSLTIMNVGDGFKVYVYSPKINTAKFQEELTKAKTKATDYLNALKAGDRTKALSYVGYSGIEKHTAEEWNSFYSVVDNSAGPINSFEINNDACQVYLNDDHEEAGHGNIYSVVAATNHGSMVVNHQIDFFQPQFDSELKIIAHNVK